jgi:hypothetical protein
MAPAAPMALFLMKLSFDAPFHLCLDEIPIWVPFAPIFLTMLFGRGTDARHRRAGADAARRRGDRGTGGRRRRWQWRDGEDHGSAAGPVERWNRVRVMPGVELHLNADRPRLKPRELRRLMELVEKALRRQVS